MKTTDVETLRMATRTAIKKNLFQAEKIVAVSEKLEQIKESAGTSTLTWKLADEALKIIKQEGQK